MVLVLEMAGLVPNFNVTMHWYLNPWVLLMLQPIKSWFHSKQKLTGRVRSRFRFLRTKIASQLTYSKVPIIRTGPIIYTVLIFLGTLQL